MEPSVQGIRSLPYAPVGEDVTIVRIATVCFVSRVFQLVLRQDTDRHLCQFLAKFYLARMLNACKTLSQISKSCDLSVAIHDAHALEKLAPSASACDFSTRFPKDFSVVVAI